MEDSTQARVVVQFTAESSPLGGGAVERGDRQVVEVRVKQAGMRGRVWGLRAALA